MAKAKKSAKSKKIVKKASIKLSKKVDSRLSIAVLVLAILIFVLAALSMGR